MNSPRRLSLCEIQGTELASSFQDQEVITSGLVIADLGVLEPGGYMLLDESCPLAGDASRGLYVSFGSGDGQVDLGDEILVQGIVKEIAGETRLEASLKGLEILSLGNPRPDPIDLEEHLVPPLVFGYEKWEGQLVAIPQAGPVVHWENPDRFLAAPRISVEPSLQLVCFQEARLSLEIRENLLSTGAGSLKDGQELEELIGLIRQNQDGYYLQLVEMPIIRSTERDRQAEGVNPADSITYHQRSPVIPNPSRIPLSKTPQPSLTSTLKSNPTIIPSSTMIPTSTIYPVRLLISEVLPNPSGEEPGGEWIEIFNPSGGKLPLDRIKIGDELSPSGKEGMLRFPDGFFINQGQVLVIANQARIFESRYGFLPDFELVDSDSRVPDLLPYPGWGRSTVKLSNVGDEVLLVDPWDRIVDLVVYGSSGTGGFSPPVEPPVEDHSLERYPPEMDRGDAGDWRERSFPSPGWLDRSPPTLAASQTSMPTPSSTNIPDPGTSTRTPGSTTSSPTLTSTSLGTSTFMPTVTQSSTPSITVTRIPTSTPSDTPVSTPPATSTASPTMEMLATGTSTVETATLIPSGTEEFTPSPTETLTPSVTVTGTMTPPPTPGPMMVINEIHADPDPDQGDSNGDGTINSDDDEFLELVNSNSQDLDLSGWGVYDEIRLRFTFPDGTVLKAGCGLVLFGGGEPAGDFGGSLVFTAGSLGLNNTGDIVRLLDYEGVEVALVSYGSEGNQDQSLTRDPDLTGLLPLVLHSQLADSEGALYSPGTRIDGTAFGSCP